MDQQILQLGLNLGAVAVVFVFAIKYFFGWLKARKDNGKNGTYGKIATEVKLIGDNHLDSIKTDINTGNDRIVDAINSMHTDLAARLGEIKGRQK